MKKITNLTMMLFLTAMGFSQVPSININRNYAKKFVMTTKISTEEKKLVEEIDKLEAAVKTQNNTEQENSTKKLIDAKKEELVNLKEKQKQQSIKENYNYKYYTNQITTIESQIKKIDTDLNEAGDSDTDRKRINLYETEKRKLEKTKENLIVERDRKADPVANQYKSFLPSFNKKYRNAFFQDTYNNSTDETNYLNSFSIAASPNGVVGQSEIITDNIHMFRVSFGTVITAANDSLADDNTKVEALKRLINGGGNFYADLTLPLVTTIKGNDENEFFDAYLFANVKAASDLKGFGNDIDASTYNSSLGLNFYGDLSSENKKFNFFCVANANYYYLSTKEFYKNLNIDHNNGFLSGKITLGVTLINQFRISANVLTFGSEPSVRDNKISVGLQFLPKL